MKHKKWTLLGLCAVLAACTGEDAETAVAGDPFERIDAFVTEAMAEVGVVPGLAVAVYTPEGTFVRGYGVTDLETMSPVTEETAFYIASSTKSLTGMTMALLDHQGRLDLDATIAEFAPEAPFPAAVRADEVTLRDLLAHTAGIENGPLAFRVAFTGEHTPEVTWQLLSYSQVNADAPLGTFDYTNVGYNILTVLTDRQLGTGWQELIDEALLDPLGMDQTTAYMSEANAADRSLARPHFGAGENGAERVQLEKIDATMQSAGGHVMSADDAVRWLEVLVEDGMIDGEQVLPAAVVQSTREPLAKVDSNFGAYQRDGYGLGWYTGTYRGEPFMHHFGGYSGFRAHISYMPEHEIGVAVFANEVPVASGLPDVVANYAYDLMLGVPSAEKEAAAGLAGLVTRRDKATTQIARGKAQRAERDWMLSQPRAAYTGTYRNAALGTLEVTLEGEALVLTMGNLRAVAEPFTQTDTVRVELVPLSGEVIEFVMGEDGLVEAVRYDGLDFARVEG